MATSTTPTNSSSAVPLTAPNGITDVTIKSYDDASSNLREKIGNLLYQSNGARQFTSFQDSMYGIDNVKNTIYMPELEGHGFTFITRPKLNLSPTSIRNDRILSLLNVMQADTIQYAMRALLDTNISRIFGVTTSVSPYLNESNPFIPILSNRLLSLNGWPDPTIDIETTQGGFFSESITYPKGSDMLARNYDISATFNDIQGSIIFTMMMLWVRWIFLANRGLITAYVEDIEARRMCFTSSIYRFVMDPSNRYITKWAKATGCFPRSVPAGAYFNYDANANNVETSMNLSIPFTVSGKVEYMDPITLREFNMLVERRTGGAISKLTPAVRYNRLSSNFRCIPYIDLSYGSNELQWRYDPSDSHIMTTTINQSISNLISSSAGSSTTQTTTA